MKNRSLSSFLTELIESLNKAEKKNFIVFSKRISKEKDLKFLQLFNLLDKTPETEDKILINKLKLSNSKNLSDLKAALYNHILESLKILYDKKPELIIRHQLDISNILYIKGQYKQSLAMLSKAKKLSEFWHQQNLRFEVIELEKKIVSRHITRNEDYSPNKLVEEANMINKQIQSDLGWSNFSLQMYEQYISIGHIRSDEQLNELRKFFNSKVNSLNSDFNSFYGNISKLQCYTWYYYITQEFKVCYKYSLQWVNLFLEHPQFISIDPELFFKGVHNLLSALFYCTDLKRYKKYLKLLNDYFNDSTLNDEQNLRLRTFYYNEIAYLNLFLGEGKFADGIEYYVKNEEKYSYFKHYLDESKQMILNYKLACLYFSHGNYKKTIKFLIEVINTNKIPKKDVYAYAQILFVVTHYELKNYTYIQEELPTIKRKLMENGEMNLFQKCFLDFFESNLQPPDNHTRNQLSELRDELTRIIGLPFEKRSVLFLDVISWIDSKIDKRSISEIISSKVWHNTKLTLKN